VHCTYITVQKFGVSKIYFFSKKIILVSKDFYIVVISFYFK